MHDAFMPIGIRTTLTDSPSVSGHFTHCWACRSVCRNTNSLVVNAPNFFTFNLYENSLQRFTLRKWTCEVVVCSHLPSVAAVEGRHS